MDVPARQSYVAVVVAPDERSAAGGITNIVRSIGMHTKQLGFAASFECVPSADLRCSLPFTSAVCG